MASKENGLGEDPVNNHPNQPLARVKKEEPIDEYGEGMDKDSRIAHLMERLLESERSARTAKEELEVAKESDADMLNMLEKTVEKYKLARNDSKRKLDESEKTREKLEESLKKEKEEREREIEETKKRQAELKKENEDLQYRLKNLTEQLERRDSSLTEVQSKLGQSESRSAQLCKALKDQRKKSDEEGTRLKDLIKLAEKKLMDTEKELVEQRKRRDEKDMELKDVIKKVEKKSNDAEKELIEQKKRSEEKEKEMKDLIKNVRKELEETQIKAADAKVEHEKLKMDHDEMRKTNGLLASTPVSKINDELIVARKRIEHLEKEVEVCTPKTSNVRANKRKKTEEHPLLTDDSNEFRNPIADSDNESTAIKNERDNMMEDDLMEKENEKETKSSGNHSKTDDSDEDFKSPVKKSRSQSVTRTSAKLNATELECPECDVVTRSVNYWVNHLHSKHSTTPSLSGLALRCECGNVSTSNSHWNKCPISNFTVIRKTTPQCVLCETYPKTALGYISHLVKHHKSALNENGIDFLKCGCGLELRNSNDRAHSNGCNPREFSIHKLDKQ